MEPIHYVISGICMVCCAWTSFHIGRRQGIETFILFLEAHTDNKNEIKLRITEDNVEFLK